MFDINFVVTMSDRRQELRDISNRLNNERNETIRRELIRRLRELEREIEQLDRQEAEYERALQAAALHKELFCDPKKKK